MLSSPESEDGPSIDGLSTSPKAAIGKLFTSSLWSHDMHWVVFFSCLGYYFLKPDSHLRHSSHGSVQLEIRPALSCGGFHQFSPCAFGGLSIFVWDELDVKLGAGLFHEVLLACVEQQGFKSLTNTKPSSPLQKAAVQQPKLNLLFLQKCYRFVAVI